MAEIKPAEISAILKKQLSDFQSGATLEEVGTVLQVGDGIARVYGLSNAQYGELVQFDNGLEAIVLNLEEDNVGVVLLGPSTGIKEGSLVVLSEEITPAKPMNLDRVNPRLGPSWSRPRGMVIVNVLINERGEVLAARILQGLAGESSETKDADEACLEAAKRVVFDPARSKEGRRVKVWQAVGFYLD